MTEREPIFGINSPDGEILAYRDNTTIYQHLGHEALNHLFVAHEEDAGIYVWQDHESYEELIKLAVGAQVMMVLNIPEPSAIDMEAYIRHHPVDLDTIPDWLPEL